MRRLILGLIACGAFAVWAAPVVSDVSLARKGDNPEIRITYTLAQEPAVITVAFASSAGAVAESVYTNLSGDVNCLVKPGTHKIRFTPGADWRALGIADANVRVEVKAWATNSPPDYLVVSLTNASEKVRYYVSTNALPVPVGDEMYKLTHLLMRRIPAANAEFRMGARTGEYLANQCSNERQRWVVLSEDYYLGVYPVTKRQHELMWGSAFQDAFWSESRFANCRRDDWPVFRIPFSWLRSYPHGYSASDTKVCLGPGTEGYVSSPAWPNDGRAVCTQSQARCACTSGTSTWLPYLGAWRTKYGLMFDLPTEAEWEFACRAETVTVLPYPTTVANYSLGTYWYDDLDAYAWTVHDSSNALVVAGCATTNMPLPRAVGLKKPNPYGLYDMLGLVAEWCLDIYSNPSDSTVTVRDPAGGSFASSFNHFSREDRVVLRGGNWCSKMELCRPAARVSMHPSYTNVDIGTVPSFEKDYSRLYGAGYRLWLPCCAAR